MKKDIKTVTLSGKLRYNPFGEWADVDKGYYVDDDRLESLLWDFRYKNVKITIEVIETDEEE